MNIIIKLKNLPWSANAADIRSFFNGLSIPEGGVHIVGGTEGNAFIAFSNDEDARMAMQRDSGKIKDVVIKLFLSSRNEMLRVIEDHQKAFKFDLQQSRNQVKETTAKEDSVPKEAEKEGELKRKEDMERVENDRESRRRSSSEDSDRGRRRRRSRSRSRVRDRSRDRRNKRRRERTRSRSRDRRRRSSRERYRERSRDRDSRRDDHDSRYKEQRREEEKSQPAPLKTPLLPSPNHPTNQPVPKPPEVATPDKETKPDHIQPQPCFFPDFRMGIPGVPGMFPGVLRNEWPVMGQQMPAGLGQVQPLMQMSGLPMTQPAVPMPPLVVGPMMTNDIISSFQLAMPEPIKNQIHQWNPPVLNKPEEKEPSTCIEIHGLPLNTIHTDIRKLLDGLLIAQEGIKLIKDNQGKRTGIAYVQFTNSEHKQRALALSGKKVKGNTVEIFHLKDNIFTSTRDKVLNGGTLQVIPEKWSEPSKPRNSRFDHHKNENIQKSITKAPFSDLVHLQGLPMNISEREIFDFFSEQGVVPFHIRFLSDICGNPTGEAVCRFETLEQAEKASVKTKKHLGKEMVTVRMISKTDLDSILSRHQTNRHMMDDKRCENRSENDDRLDRGEKRALLKGDPRKDRRELNFENQEMCKPMPLIQHNTLNDDLMKNEIRGEFPFRPNGDFRNDFEFDKSMGREPGRMNWLDCERGGMRGRGKFGRPFLHPMHKRGTRGGRFYQHRPPHEDLEPEVTFMETEALYNFGRPGCVVSLENVNYRASIDDILHFFREFQVEHENVIRKFDDIGRPTGDARVAFRSPDEARDAIQVLNHKVMLGRSIKLSLLS